MKNSKLRSAVALARILSSLVEPAALVAQTSTTPSQTTPAASTPASSAAAGITSGTAPIETTLFAYRALASDAEAIAGEVETIAGHQKIVMGSASDVASFVQWRTVVSQTRLLTKRAEQIHEDLDQLEYPAPVPLAALSIGMSHSGNFVQGQGGTYAVTVSNSPAASPTAGTVTVTETVPIGLTLVSMAGPGWDCSPPNGTPPPGNSCSRNNSLSPGASYPVLTITVNVSADAAATVINSVTVAGGGSASASATDSTNVVASRPSRPRSGASVRLEEQSATAPVTAPSTGAAATPPAGPFSTALTAIPAFVQLAQFLSTAFAVTETLSPSQGSMTDAPLINAVAQQLRNDGATLFVPSVYPPNLLNGKTLDQLYLWKYLRELETARLLLIKDVGRDTGLLMQANFVTQNPTKYSAAELNRALLFSGKAQSIITSAQAIEASIDSFDASLFGGQVVTQTASTPQASTTPSGSTGSAAGSTTGSANTTPSTPSTGATNTAAAAGSASQSVQSAQASSQGSTATSSSPGQSSGVLQQIIASDLLAERIWERHPEVTEDDMNSVVFLTLHALESGGSQLVKTNLFYGTHIFFSGGSVATFGLYKSIGDLTCSGFAYNYRGNVREKNFDAALHDPPTVRAILSTSPGCAGTRSLRSDANQIRPGMTSTQVEAILGLPDAKFKQKGTNYLYKSRNLFVLFRRGVVVRVVMAN